MIQQSVLGKVTCFITREKENNIELLLIQHPNAGIQLPAGTVEINEDFRRAAWRETFEETGLNDFLSCTYIGKQEQILEGDYIVYESAKVYSRPDLLSSHWAEIRRGITVKYERRSRGFVQISYIEGDKYPDPNYISYQITGWVEESRLASIVSRHFFHLHSDCMLNKWEQAADDHTFKLFWSPLYELPEIVSPQNQWVKFVINELNYSFQMAKVASDNRIEKIRMKEKQYHDDCYENLILFQEGSWLHKPVKTILEQYELLNQNEDMRLLDLGCGVGRNSIPLALKLKQTRGKVVCVDLIDSAIHNLEKYGKQYGVMENLEMFISDLSEFSILPNYFDYIFSVSTLEHLDSMVTFDQVVKRMIDGTREHGINCLIISSNIREVLMETGEKLDPMFELLFETDELLYKLKDLYTNWQVLKQTVKSYEIEITRDGKPVLLASDVVTWSVQKSAF